MQPNQEDPSHVPTNPQKLAFYLLVAFLLISGIIFILQGIILIR